MTNLVSKVPKNAIISSFNNAASTYDAYAVLQQDLEDRLIDRLQDLKLNPSNILDLGSGTGSLLFKLNEMYSANLYGLDIAFNMSLKARSKVAANFICSDMDYLTLADNSIDLIVSNCSLQWVIDLKNVFSEIFRVLAPGGTFLFTSFGPGTLYELYSAWGVDNKYHSMQDVGNYLLQNNFKKSVLDQDNIVMTYSKLIYLLKDLKSIGANLNSNVQQGMYTHKTLQRIEQSYTKVDGVLPATYNVLYGIARK